MEKKEPMSEYQQAYDCQMDQAGTKDIKGDMLIDEGFDITSEIDPLDSSMYAGPLMAGFDRELRMYLIPRTGFRPQEVTCRFTIDDLIRTMSLDDNMAITFDPAYMITKAGAVCELWVVRSCDTDGSETTAVNRNDVSSFRGPILIMKRIKGSQEPMSLNEDEVDMIRSSIRIITRTYSSKGYQNGYVLMGLGRCPLDADSVEVGDGSIPSFKVKLPFGNPPAINVLNSCLENMKQFISIKDLSLEIAGRMIIEHRSKAAIAEHIEEYNEVISNYDDIVIRAYVESIEKLNGLSDEQVSDIVQLSDSWPDVDIQSHSTNKS